jgi:hypothetical protein
MHMAQTQPTGPPAAAQLQADLAAMEKQATELQRAREEKQEVLRRTVMEWDEDESRQEKVISLGSAKVIQHLMMQVRRPPEETEEAKLQRNIAATRVHIAEAEATERAIAASPQRSDPEDSPVRATASLSRLQVLTEPCGMTPIATVSEPRLGQVIVTSESSDDELMLVVNPVKRVGSNATTDEPPAKLSRCEVTVSFPAGDQLTLPVVGDDDSMPFSIPKCDRLTLGDLLCDDLYQYQACGPAGWQRDPDVYAEALADYWEIHTHGFEDSAIACGVCALWHGLQLNPEQAYAAWQSILLDSKSFEWMLDHGPHFNKRLPASIAAAARAACQAGIGTTGRVQHRLLMVAAQAAYVRRALRVPYHPNKDRNIVDKARLYLNSDKQPGVGVSTGWAPRVIVEHRSPLDQQVDEVLPAPTRLLTSRDETPSEEEEKEEAKGETPPRDATLPRDAYSVRSKELERAQRHLWRDRQATARRRARRYQVLMSHLQNMLLSHGSRPSDRAAWAATAARLLGVLPDDQRRLCVKAAQQRNLQLARLRAKAEGDTDSPTPELLSPDYTDDEREARPMPDASAEALAAARAPTAATATDAAVRVAAHIPGVSAAAETKEREMQPDNAVEMNVAMVRGLEDSPFDEDPKPASPEMLALLGHAYSQMAERSAMLTDVVAQATGAQRNIAEQQDQLARQYQVIMDTQKSLESETRDNALWLQRTALSVGAWMRQGEREQGTLPIQIDRVERSMPLGDGAPARRGLLLTAVLPIKATALTPQDAVSPVSFWIVSDSIGPWVLDTASGVSIVTERTAKQLEARGAVKKPYLCEIQTVAGRVGATQAMKIYLLSKSASGRLHSTAFVAVVLPLRLWTAQGVLGAPDLLALDLVRFRSVDQSMVPQQDDAVFGGHEPAGEQPSDQLARQSILWVRPIGPEHPMATTVQMADRYAQRAGAKVRRLERARQQAQRAVGMVPTGTAWMPSFRDAAAVASLTPDQPEVESTPQPIRQGRQGPVPEMLPPVRSLAQRPGLDDRCHLCGCRGHRVWNCMHRDLVRIDGKTEGPEDDPEDFGIHNLM